MEHRLSPCYTVCRDMAPTLKTLPHELFLDILDYLPASAHISLKLVNKRFNSLIPKATSRHWKAISRCERYAICRFLNEPRFRRDGVRQCVICCGIYPNNDAYLRGFAPICTWHTGMFESLSKPKYLEPPIKRRLKSAKRLDHFWVVLKRDFCIHNRAIQNWKEPAHSRKCSCDHCGHFAVDCLIRVSTSKDEPNSWEISKDERWVIESDQPDCKFHCVDQGSIL